jgi:hypothetical protein
LRFAKILPGDDSIELLSAQHNQGADVIGGHSFARLASASLGRNRPYSLVGTEAWQDGAD